MKKKNLIPDHYPVYKDIAELAKKSASHSGNDQLMLQLPEKSKIQ